MLKLNLGCGYTRMDGYVNVDVSAACNPDLVADLEEVPWPWANDADWMRSFARRTTSPRSSRSRRVFANHRVRQRRPADHAGFQRRKVLSTKA
jgi:hypothetical protein